jgi:Domain of unknown function (DUF4371)/hAT family C-terminal dimerisation region
LLFLFAVGDNSQHESSRRDAVGDNSQHESSCHDAVGDNSQHESSRRDAVGDNSQHESSRRDAVGDKGICHPANYLAVSGKFPFQPNATAIVHQQLKLKKLYFQQSWFEKYPWLHYDAKLKAVLCFYCSEGNAADLLGSTKCAETTFITSGFSNWKKATGSSGRFELHQSSHCHRVAQQALVDKCMTVPVSKLLSKQLDLEQVTAQKCLRVLFTTCQYLLQQGLSFRGHDESSGNFNQLLILRSQDVPEMKQWLERQHAFTHHSIQNEIMQLFSDAVLRKLSSMIRQSQSFAVIVDGTQDIQRTEQESICIRYVDQNLQPVEVFMGFYAVGETTGSNLANCIEDAMIRFQLSLENLRGQTYDGAANMKGAYRGCQALIAKKQPLAIYVHCGAHCINLVASDACSASPKVRDSIQVVHELGVVCAASGKFKSLFSAISSSDDEVPSRNIKPLCPTRWLVRLPAIVSVLTQYGSILKALADAHDACSPDVASTASSLLSKFEDGATLAYLVMAKDIIEPLETLNRSLQSARMTVAGMLEAIDVLKHQLLAFRTVNHFDEIFEGIEVQIAQLDLEPVRLPRARQPPKRFSGPADAFHPKTAREQLRIEYFKIIDVAVQQLNERFCDSVGLKQYSELEKILLSGQVSDLASTYPELQPVNTLQVEISMLRTTQNMDGTKSSVDDYAKLLMNMSPEVRGMFPHVEALVRLLLVNPASSASAERSFSSLRRLKTYLRSTIGQARLNHVAISHIHNATVCQIDLKELMKQFIMHKDNRIAVFGKL